jgi:hypothetical protein
MTLSGTGTYLGLSCQSWQAASGTFEQDATFTQGQTVVSTANPTTGSNKTPVKAGSLVIGVLLTNSQIPSAAGAGYILLDTEPNDQLFPEYQVQSLASPTNAPFVMSSDSWTDQMAAFYFGQPTVVSAPALSLSNFN